MSYIIMAAEACGTEVRYCETTFSTEEAAYEQLIVELGIYEEARSMWVEELHDKAYYSRRAQQMYDNDERDLY